MTQALLQNGLKRAYFGFMWLVLISMFWLMHSTQSSSQTLATLFLLLSPILLAFKAQQPIPDAVRYFLGFAIGTFIFALMLFFHHDVSTTSYSTLRGLTFYLLAPGIFLLLWNTNFNKEHMFLVLFAGSLISLYPVLRELHEHGSTLRGALSSHPIFWGNIVLTTGFVTFVLSRDSEMIAKGPKLLGWIALVAALTASFWSLTRGGWISIPIALLLLIGFRIINKKQLAIIILAITAVVFSSDKIQYRIMKTFQSFENGISLDGSTQVRIDMWSVATDAFLANPSIGGGLDAFSEHSKELKEEGKISFYFEHAHNEYMEILASRGIIGSLIFMGLIFCLLNIYIRNFRSLYAKAGIIAVSQYLIYSLSETFFSVKITIMYFLLINILLVVMIHKHPPESSNIDGQKI